MREDIYWFWRNNVGRYFSKLFCKLWGHPGPEHGERLTIVIYGVTVLEACMACGGKIYERPKDQPLENDPDFDPTPCDCVIGETT